MGYHITGLSSPSPVSHNTSHLVPPRSLSPHLIYSGRVWERLWKRVKSDETNICIFTAVHTGLHQQQLVRQTWRASFSTDHHHDLVPDCFHVRRGRTLWCHQHQICLRNAGKVSKRGLPPHGLKILQVTTLFHQEKGGDLQQPHCRCGCRDHADQQRRQILWNDHSGEEPVWLLCRWAILWGNHGEYHVFICLIHLLPWPAGLGQSTHLMYLGEISLRKFRGMVTLTFVIFTSLGKLSGQFFGLRYALFLSSALLFCKLFTTKLTKDLMYLFLSVSQWDPRPWGAVGNRPLCSGYFLSGSGSSAAVSPRGSQIFIHRERWW